MNRTFLFVLPALFLVMTTTVRSGYSQSSDLAIDPNAYPDVRIGSDSDTFHGIDVPDPFRWMENLDSGELRTWLEAQDSLLKAHIPDPQLVAALADEIREWRRRATMLPPIVRGPWRFTYFGTPGQLVQDLYVTRNSDAPIRHASNADPGRLLVDMHEAREANQYVSTGTVSPRGAYVPVLSSEGPTRWKTLSVIQTDSGETLPDRLTGVISGTSVAWTADESGFFYPRYEVPDDPQAALGKPRIYFHELGTSQDDDRFVWEQPGGDELTVNARGSSDGRYLILEASASGGTFSGLFDRIFIAPLDAERASTTTVRELFEGSDAQLAVEGARGSRLILRTSEGADNLRLIAIDPTGQQPVESLVQEQPWPIQGVAEYRNHLLVRYLRDTKNFLRVITKDGAVVAEFDDQANNIFGLSENPTETVAWYGISRLVEPGTVFQIDLETLARSLYFRPELPLDPGAYTSDVVYASSEDGTRIPVSLVYRSDLDLDGSAPLFMYAYGAWAWSAFPWQQYMIPWLRRGGIYAVAHVRGGGEFGANWHSSGIRRNREAWIADYLAAAEHMIDAGYTTPDRLVANGGSASGMLPAIAINRRPELFGAAMIDYPFLDMIRMKEFGSGAAYIPEYGDPDVREDFDVLISYSPYHRIEKGRCYPFTMVQAGSEDETSTPMHAYKYVAAMQQAQSCDNPVLLKIAWAAGHTSGATAEQRAETQAQELVYLMHVTRLVD